MKTFETERLFLKPTSVEDAPLLLTLLYSPKWLQYIGDRNVRNIEQAEDYITHKMRPQMERLGFGNFTIIRKDDQHKIGSCGLYDREGLEGIDIGFALLPDYEKKGYAFEAVNKLKDLANEHFKLKEISGITSKKNKASQALLMKIGLKYEKDIVLPNETEEIQFYKLTY
ncbi:MULTISPECIES: GNAT family N-acetyltransferase [unclassified Flavobacterium]|uniref:GNAT family N-acetyltransferase n=1 Tax=unclassified Flavobacterium TaxID=196869 RepID=UPI003F8E8E3D